MVKRKSTTRLPSLNKAVILTQTDTTVGFLSQDAQKLYEIKERENTKPFIKVYSSFKALNSSTCRVPKKQRRFARRAKKTSFIVNGISFRVAKTKLHSQILREDSWFYSTSANKSKENFNREFCEDKTDIIIEDKKGLFENDASSLIKLSQNKRKKLR
jgi:tRNA A37 threonylcarbamoyladenosine synthetase subunit TsaC/SUA5/YrdC